jgi:cytochrome c oxidase cbb3-type subunit IV
MFKHYFESMDGLDIYPIFSLLVFLIFFISVSVWCIKADKNYLKKMEEIPLENND